jgi:hypothetical protein
LLSMASWHRIQYGAHGTAASHFGWDVLIALLTHRKAAFLDTTESSTGVSKLVKFPVEITDREGRVVKPPGFRPVDRRFSQR